MRRSRLPLAAGIGVLLFLYVPMLVLVGESFNASRFGGGWEGFSLKWYGLLFQNRPIWDALRNSVFVGAVATAVSVVLGTLSAWALHRYRGPLQRVHYALVYAPLVLPDVLMGISLLLLFINAGVPLGLGSICLAHITFCISYVAFVVLGRLQEFDDSVLDAARDLGAGWWTTCRLVVLPMLAPGIISGGLLAFTLSLDDFVVTFFVAGPGSTTLPVHVYSMIRHGSPTLINALSALLMAATFGLVLVGQRVIRQWR